MKTRFLGAVLFLSLCAVLNAAPPAASGDAASYSDKKWYQNGKGYAEALEIQKNTGAPLFVYFARYGESDEKGLCHWFEKRLLQVPTVEKELRSYVKVKFMFPLNKDDTAIAEQFYVKKTPAVYAVPAEGQRQRLTPFNWTNKSPKPVLPDEFVSELRDKSGHR